MTIRFEFAVTVTIVGMDELIAAVRGELSSDELQLLNDVLSGSKMVSGRLVRIDESRPRK